MKPVTWMGSAKRDLVACAPDVRQVVGRELERVQRGADPTDWKPMASVGPGAREIRVHVGGERRVVYVATFPEAVYVLHVFEKKTRKTSKRDLALGQQRYEAMVQVRRTS
jgi:phage-related protein